MGTGRFTLYGNATPKQYKLFVGTWGPAGGAIRVVMVAEPTECVAFFSTAPTASVADILGPVADRFAAESRPCADG